MAMIPHSSIDGVIYTITNTVTTTVYVGRTNNISNRWSQHRSQLRDGTHANRHLQRAWLKYGEQAFVFAVIDRASTHEALAKAEHYHINRLRSAGIELYNAREADGTWYVERPPQTKATRQKRSETAKRKGIRPGKLAQDRARQASLGRIPTESQKAKWRASIGDALKRIWTPAKRAEFGQRLQGKPKTRTAKLEAKWEAQRGRKEDPAQTARRIAAQAEKRGVVYVFRDPQGNKYTTNNLAEFARIHGLHERLLQYVATGKQRHHRGWMLVSRKEVPA